MNNAKTLQTANDNHLALEETVQDNYDEHAKDIAELKQTIKKQAAEISDGKKQIGWLKETVKKQTENIKVVQTHLVELEETAKKQAAEIKLCNEKQAAEISQLQKMVKDLNDLQSQ